METGNSELRERLLARLPQPENLGSYRDEVASLLAKHQRALYWSKWLASVLSFCALVMVMIASPPWGHAATVHTTAVFGVMAGFMFLWAGVSRISYCIDESKVELLSEIKQTQIQILELQASIGKTREQ
jgi:hypothetical protein